jgi:hypothetical protein
MKNDLLANRRFLILAVVMTFTLALCGATSGENILFDFEGGFNIGQVETRDVDIALHTSGGNTALRIRSGHRKKWPGITIKSQEGKWDLSDYRRLAVDVANTGSSKVTVNMRVDNPNSDGSKHCLTKSLSLQPGGSGTLEISVGRSQWKSKHSLKLIRMRGDPDIGPDWAGDFDSSNVVRLLVFVSKPKQKHSFTIDNIRVEGSRAGDAGCEFFPFIDEYGQYMHKDWPGKIHRKENFEKTKIAEEKDLIANPGGGQWNRYGGWQAGPQLAASGFFRVEKYNNQWWMVDPDGRLFWSHGIDCVNHSNGVTPVSDRLHYFTQLPDADSPMGSFYGSSSWFWDTSYRTFNFTPANLYRKYGDDWKDIHGDLAHRRLRSWGLNTIGNWSGDSIYLQRKTPYVVSVHFPFPNIEGSEGHWSKFPDVFSLGFRDALRRRLEKEKGKSAGDKWCIGYFLDNELGWGDELSLALATLKSPAEQEAKKTFLKDLRKKYSSIKKLNRAWGTNHVSWDALLECREPPDRKKARKDLAAFYTKIAETFFRICGEEVKRIAPDNLYLGCRFAWVNSRAVQASAKYCDVVSYNFYKKAPFIEKFKLPADLDKPVMLGEFHFGALDRGMLHTGLVPVKNQQERARHYKAYIRAALGNAQIVGAHWFQYSDQATTGRGDGENYQIGFIDVCDTPYQETIAASREVGAHLYKTRSGSEGGR